MNKHDIIQSIKKIVVGNTEHYRFGNNRLKFLTGSRPIKRKYLNAGNDVVRNDVLQINYMEDNFKESDVLWDIGSHHGHYSIFAATIAKANNQVFSFEPDAVARKIQAGNIELNGFADKITIFPDAVSNTNGVLHFKELNGNSNSHIVKNKSTNDNQINAVNSVTLDSLTEILPCPTFVKIDTEGAEIDILSTAGSLLKNKNVQFICELHPFAWDEFNVKYETFTGLLKEHGRTLTLLDNRKHITDLPFYGTVLF
jgi:FkbM family methyltransferase